MLLLVDRSSCLQLHHQDLVAVGRPGTFVKKNCTRFTCTAAREIFLFTFHQHIQGKPEDGCKTRSALVTSRVVFASSTGQKNSLRPHLLSKSTLFLFHLHLLSTLVSVKCQAAARQPCNYCVTKGKLKKALKPINET